MSAIGKSFAIEALITMPALEELRLYAALRRLAEATDRILLVWHSMTLAVKILITLFNPGFETIAAADRIAVGQLVWEHQPTAQHR